MIPAPVGGEMPYMSEYPVLDAAVLVALRMASLATFSLAAVLAVGVGAWAFCCSLEAKRRPGGPDSGNR